MNLERLNTGLTRVVSLKSYPQTRRQPLPRSTKGRVFRLGVLHSKEMTDTMLLRNRRGFVNSQVNTVAHAPSIYHWLFHRCGVPFEESRELARIGGITANGSRVDPAGLEAQLDWATLQRLDLRLCTDAMDDAKKNHTSGKPDSTAAPQSGGDSDGNRLAWVPALKRALHRKYFFIYLRPGVSLSSDHTDPRSFVHRLTPRIGATAALGLNILRPIGFMNSMRGLGLATNDVSMVRYWNNEFLGNYGVFDIRFLRGVPSEVLHRLAASVRDELETRVRPQLPRDVSVPCSCEVNPVPPRGDGVTGMYKHALHNERLIVRTPLLPYRCARRLRRAGGFVTMTRAGPFALPHTLPQVEQRQLSPQELALMFTFEQKLKINRLILSLREFDEERDEGGEVEGELPSMNANV